MSIITVETDLNRPDGHIDINLPLSQIAESSHGKADVVQVFDGSRQSLLNVFDEGKDVLHLCVVLLVAGLAVMESPCLRFGRQSQLQFF